MVEKITGFTFVICDELKLALASRLRCIDLSLVTLCSTWRDALTSFVLGRADVDERRSSIGT